MDKGDTVIELESKSALPIAFAVLVVLMTIAIYLLKVKFSNRRNTILIIGLNDSGKTVIFSRLINYDFFPETYSSFKENEYKFFRDAAGRELTLIDIPGAERLRKRLLHKYLSEKRRSIRGIIFVIDSSTFGRKSRDVAELLYDVLYESRKCVPSLVTCNKQDSSLAKSSRVIHITLEHEFGLINGTREAALDSTDGDMKKRVLTATGKDFQWNDLMTTKIDFIECCAIKGFNGGEDGGRKTGLSSVRDWIDSL